VLLLCLALGPHLPEWVIGPLRAIQRNRDRIARRSRSACPQELDRSRATAVLCGVGPYLRGYELLLQHFFWTPLTLVLLNAFGLALLMGAAWCVQGLIIVMLTRAHEWGRPDSGEQWSSGGQTLLGFALGSALASGWLAGGMSGHQLYLIGALPLFVMSVVCVGIRRPPTAASNAVSPLSEAPDQAATDVWLCVASLLVWAVATVLVVEGLLLGERSTGYRFNSFSWFLLGIGIGSLGRLRGFRWPGVSLSDAGLMLLGCGLAGALAFQLQLWDRWNRAGLALAGVALGYGLHRLEQAGLARLGRERIACSQLITAVCAGAAVGLAIAHWWVLPVLGSAGLLILGILIFLGMAGILQIYTQDRPGHVRHSRLGVVFAALAAAILVFPAQVREALHRQRLAARPTQDSPEDPWLATLFTQSRSTCVLAPLYPQELRGVENRRVTFLPTGGTGDMPYPGSAMFNLLTSHRRFDLIYQCWPEAGGHFPQYSLEWCERLARAAAPEGFVVIDVPHAGLTERALDLIASTVARACGGRVAVAPARRSGQRRRTRRAARIRSLERADPYPRVGRSHPLPDP
jgi:hypothetical protein